MAYTTLSDLKSYLGITESDDDTVLSALINAAQAAIDAYTGRIFEAQSDTTRYLDAVADVDKRLLYLDEDLAQITTVTNGDNTTVTSAQYTTLPRNETPYYAIKLLASASVAWTYTDDPEGAIAITGRWAYSVSAPNDIVQACKRLAGYFYRQRDAQVFDVTAQPDVGIMQIPQGMPADVKVLLRPYKRLV